MLELWNSRARVTPAEQLLHLSEECSKLKIVAADVYGDFDSNPEHSYLRRFEQEVCTIFGKEDALFLPSGVAAQQIALQIHFDNAAGKDRAYVCHYSSHLLLHEKDTSQHLLNMKPLVVAASEGVRDQQPISYSDILNIIKNSTEKPATVIVECPHREVGGKATPYSDLEKISLYCRSNGIAFHMDGARLWEALAHYTTRTTSEGLAVTPEILCGLFDSVYLSTYKGIGGMTGALLLGDANFIAQARVWLRRYGGNVFTLLPYAVSAYSSFRKYLEWNNNTLEAYDGSSNAVPYSMRARLSRLKHLAALLTQQFEEVPVPYVRFDPPVPVVPLIHVFIRASVAVAMEAHERSKAASGVACFARVRPVAVATGPDGVSYPEECYFEFNMGIMNGAIADQDWLRGWAAFTDSLESLQSVPVV